VVIVPPEGGLEFRWDSDMCWCFIHVTINLVSGTTQRSVIESCITNVSSSPRETVPPAVFAGVGRPAPPAAVAPMQAHPLRAGSRDLS